MLRQVLFERPEPHAVAVDLEVRPRIVVLRKLERAVERVARRRHRLRRRSLSARDTVGCGGDHRAVRLHAAPDPAMPGLSRILPVDDVERVRAERPVAQPGVAVNGERRAGDERTGRRLARLEHFDAAGNQRVRELPLQVGRGGHQPFRAPDAMPLTNWRWKVTKIASTGRIAINEAAKTRPQLVECWPWKSAIAIGSVRRLGSLITVSAQTNSSQLARNVKIATVASAGRDNGMISCP